MPTQAFPYLVMTDGTLTATFADGSGGATSFAPLRGTWAPAIATRRRAALGRSPWTDVIEQWDLTIKGADAATALSNLETLTRLLDNADRFWRLGENVSPVLLKYAPQGSTIFSTANPATCLVLGRASGDETNISLPPNENDVGMIFEIRPVRLKFVRTGQWLNPTAETTTITAAAANPTVQTANFTSNLVIASPTQLTCNFSSLGSSSNGSATAPAFILWANNTSRLQIYEAESGALGANVASVADAAGKARGGNVARYSPGALGTTIAIALSGWDSNARRVAVFAAVRNNSGTTTWTIQAKTVFTGRTNAAGPIVPIDTSSLNPRIVFLGIMTSRDVIQQILLALTASTAAGTLDIDYICLQAIDDETSGAISTWDDTGLSIGEDPVFVAPSALTAPTPLVRDGGFLAPYTGDAYIMTKGQSYAAVWLGTSGTFWRTCNTSNVLLDTQFTASRLNGYLSPR